ncbi:hypothetical protein KCU99_g6632, partial [Aureobasidium melanogenum]
MSKKKGSKQQPAANGHQVPGPKNEPSSGQNNATPQGPKNMPPAGPKNNQSFGPRDNQPFRPQNNQPFRPQNNLPFRPQNNQPFRSHNNQNFGPNGHQGFHPNSQPFKPRNNQSFDSKVNNNNNWQKPDPAAINKLVQAHQLKATQGPQQAPVAISTLQHAEGGAIQDAATTDLPQPESAPAEAEQAQELPADVPPTLAEHSVPAPPTDLPASVTPVAASSEKLQEGRQSDINNTSGNPSSTQLLYAMWEAQLTKLKNKWLDQMKDDFQNLLGPFEPLQDHTPSSKGLDIDLDYQQWESAYRKENGQSRLDFSTDTITLGEAQDALRKLQAEKTAKKQMYNVLQMYARAEASFLEDTRAKFADFGSRTLALHHGFVQNEAALKERVTRFMDA